MSPSIGLIIHARLGSTRCPRKVLRPFAGTTLLEIALEKLAGLQTPLGRYLAAGDDEIIEVARRFPEITVVERTPESLAVDGPPSVTMSHLTRLPETHFLFVNPCLPFVPASTWLDAAADFALRAPRTMTSVFRNRGWFYTTDGESVNCRDGQVCSTQETSPLLEVAHAFHVLERDRLLAEDHPWANVPGDPALFEIPREQAWDIDHEDEFEAVARLYELRTAPV